MLPITRLGIIVQDQYLPIAFNIIKTQGCSLYCMLFENRMYVSLIAHLEFLEVYASLGISAELTISNVLIRSEPPDAAAELELLAVAKRFFRIFGWINLAFVQPRNLRRRGKDLGDTPASGRDSDWDSNRGSTLDSSVKAVG